MKTRLLAAVLAVASSALLGSVLLLRTDCAVGHDEPQGTLAAHGRRRVGETDEPDPDGQSFSAEGDSRVAISAGNDDAAGRSFGDDGIELVPVVGAGRRRVEAAELWWWRAPVGSQAAGLEGFDELFDSGRVDEHLEARAVRLVEDERGRFHVPRSSAGHAIARARGLWGYRRIEDSSPSPSYVELEAEVEIVARVVDHMGAPVESVRVALREVWGRNSARDIGHVETDAQGVARLRRVRQLVGRRWDYSAQYMISIGEPLGQLVGQVIDPTRPPAERIELVLPPCGAVEVELEGAPEDLEVALELLDPAEITEADGDRREAQSERRVRGGRARFPFVGLGHEVVARTRSGWRESFHDDARTSGPRGIGETVRVRVDLRPQRVRLAGRLVSPGGAPLPEASFDLGLRNTAREEHVGGRWSVSTDGGGRFDVELLVAGGRPDQARLGLTDRGGARLATAVRPLPENPGDATWELGDIAFDSLPFLVAGRVVDPDGAPVPRARIRVFERPDPEKRQRATGPLWRISRDLSATADSRGRFEVRGELSLDAMALQPVTDDRLGEAVELQPQERDVVLVLDHGGFLSGRLLLPSAVAREHVMIKVVARDRDPARPGDGAWTRFQVDEAGEFAVRGLPDGTYDVEISHPGLEGPLASIRGVEVVAGDGARDPRLDPLDLRSSRELVALTVRGPDGRLVEAGQRLWASAIDPDECEGSWFSHGRLLVDRGDPLGWIAAEGCALERLDPALAPALVNLRRAPSVRVALAEGRELPEPPLHLELELFSRGEPPWLTSECADRLEFAPHGVAEGVVRRLGALSARLRLIDEDREAIDLPCELVGDSELVDSPLVQALTVAYDAADLAAALERLRK